MEVDTASSLKMYVTQSLNTTYIARCVNNNTVVPLT